MKIHFRYHIGLEQQEVDEMMAELNYLDELFLQTERVSWSIRFRIFTYTTTDYKKQKCYISNKS